MQSFFSGKGNPFCRRSAVTVILAAIASLMLVGCAHYVPPSGRADLSSISSQTMKESFAAKPAAGIPVAIAAVRIQKSGYKNYNLEREGGVHGRGRYSVITVKEVEEAADVDRIAKLQDVHGIISINTLLLPDNLNSDKDIREAAARLKADMVLLYTFETSFHQNDDSMALSVVSLGISPTKRISVKVAASALLMDTRTGFIYGAYEANKKREFRTNAWESQESADRSRRVAEKEAFTALIDELEKSWPKVIERAKQGA